MKVGHLIRIAGEGFADMLPALRQAFNASDDDDNLDSVFGANPRGAIAGLTIAAIAIGYLLDQFVTGYALEDYVHWPVLLVSVGFAIPIRRYLFRSGQASPEDFPWLAAAVIPAIAIVAALALLNQLFAGESLALPEAPFWTGIGALLIHVANAVAEAAAVTLAVAALCFSRDPVRAFWDLVVLLFILKLIIWVFVTILLEIGIMEKIVGRLVEQVFNVDIPDWVGELSDQASYGMLLLAIGLGTIGATWTVCRHSLSELLADGDVNIAANVRTMIDPPDEKKVARKAAKAEKKAAAKAAKAARREARKR